jgi:2-aminoethylphosphonate dioxygenase
MAMSVSAVGLSPEQLAEYQRLGYLIVRDVFARDEIADLADEAEQLRQRSELIDVKNIRCRWQDHIETGACLFECFDPVIDIGPVCRRIAYDRRILGPLTAIYGDEACLFKDKLIYKPPGAKGYGLHQDYIGWQDFPRSFVTVLVAIDAADAENGATEVFPEVHRQGYLSPIDGEYHEVPADKVDPSSAVKLELQPGDIALFGCFTPHRSAPNGSDRWRRQLYLSYNAARDGGQRRAAHYEEFHSWLKVKYAQYGKIEVYFR